MGKMKNAPFVKEIRKLCENLYRLGWDERNGGNVSYLISEEEAAPYLEEVQPGRVLELGFDAAPLAGRLILATGSGKYFKNVREDPKNNLGLVRIGPEGTTAEVLWGFADGSRPTSEFPAHLMSHMERLKADPEHRIVIHTHTTNVVAMTFVHDLEEREFTRTLWKMCTECVVVFPEGIGVLPWMLCGTEEIGRATAEKMKDFRLVVWSMHGIYGAGRTPDEAFGLIETVEKAAEVYMKIINSPRKQEITDAQLQILADAFGVTPHTGWLQP